MTLKALRTWRYCHLVAMNILSSAQITEDLIMKATWTLTGPCAIVWSPGPGVLVLMTTETFRHSSSFMVHMTGVDL